MDPYLEDNWGDVHQSFITYARDQIQEMLPGDLRARVEERVLVESPEGDVGGIFPDLRVVERRRIKVRNRVGSSAMAFAEPLRIGVPDEPATEGYIEIIDKRAGRRVVTVLEVLSPANKIPGTGLNLYRKKQQACVQSAVNLVEIDLLRIGRWVLAIPEPWVPRSYRTTYRVCVTRAKANHRWEVYRVPLRERLPTIRVPLRPSDADVPLDLQALIDRCYQHGDYEDDLDYQTEPQPPLEPKDARWANKLLRDQGKRSSRARRSRPRES
jgi:hypothetical protein